jgi:hypothetical protein
VDYDKNNPTIEKEEKSNETTNYLKQSYFQ